MGQRRWAVRRGRPGPFDHVYVLDGLFRPSGERGVTATGVYRLAGITAPPAVGAWQARERMPKRANRARLDPAYWDPVPP